MTLSEKVSLFLPCLADMFYPRIGRDTISVLTKAGFSVDYPTDQTCCGQPAYTQGLLDPARKMARHFIRIFESSPAVVCPSGSCVLTVRQHYPELFKDEPDWLERAEAIGARTFELTDFLVNQAGRTELEARFPGRVTLHDSCHPLRGLGSETGTAPASGKSRRPGAGGDAEFRDLLWVRGAPSWPGSEPCHRPWPIKKSIRPCPPGPTSW